MINTRTLCVILYSLGAAMLLVPLLVLLRNLHATAMVANGSFIIYFVASIAGGVAIFSERKRQ